MTDQGWLWLFPTVCLQVSSNCRMRRGEFTLVGCICSCSIHFQISLQQEYLHWLHRFLFSTVLFQMSLQIACQRRCKVALVAFARFVSLCVFKCLLKSPARKHVKSHCLHLFDFPPLCVCMCALRALA